MKPTRGKTLNSIPNSGGATTAQARQERTTVDLQPNVGALFHAMSATWTNELERQLANDLWQRDVFAVKDFRLPGGPFRADFFLPTPPFGIIEIKVVQTGFSNPHDAIAQVSRRLQEVRATFGNSARAYVAIFQAGGPPGNRPPPTSQGVVVCISAGMDTAEIADQIAGDFQSYAVRVPGRTLPPATSLLADTDDLTKPLSQLMFSLERLMTDTQRIVLLDEFARLRDEVGHGHFTAAALRVGRSLEFILYTACTSWGVTVREPLLLGLSRLDNQFNALKKALITYASVADDEKRRTQAKGAYTKRSVNLSAVLMEILVGLDEHAAPQDGRAGPPINTGALLTEIGRKFSAIDDVRRAVNAADRPLTDLNALRNRAAHAPLDGGAHEVSGDEVSAMITSLCQIVHNLTMCGNAIVGYRQSTAKTSD